MKKQMGAIVEYMKNNVLDGIQVEEVAHHFGYSKFHFSRMFKRISGFSASEYLSALKMESSLNAISKKSTILSSHLKSGFLSAGSFSTAFSKTTGLSPKACQNKQNDLFAQMKQYENTNFKEEVTHYTEPSHCSSSRCAVTVELPENYKNGVLFVGLFHRPIPNHLPVVGKALVNSLSCCFDKIPNGTYYLLACSIEKSLNPLDYFLLHNSLRGKVEDSISFPQYNHSEFTVRLRKPIATDPPILVNFPQLLSKNLKK